jgi:hypothetical protein
MTAYLCVLGAAILRPEKRQSLRVTTQLKSEFREHGGVSSQGTGKSLLLSQVFEYGTQGCSLGYSDFHNLMGFISKKMPNNIL